MNTKPGELQEEARFRRGIKFDGTVNLGHIGTMVVMLGSLFGIYNNLDKRISKQEDMAPFVQTSRDQTDARVQASLNTLSSDLKDVKVSVDKLTLSVQVQSAVTNATTKGTK